MKRLQRSTMFRFAMVLFAGLWILWLGGCKRGEIGRKDRGGASTAVAPTTTPEAQSPAPASAEHPIVTSLAAARPSTGTVEEETTAADIPSTAPRLILSGRVTLKKDGSAAAGATIELIALEANRDRSEYTESPAGSTRSDAAGRYSLVVRDRRYFRVVASRAGFARATTYIRDSDSARGSGNEMGVRRIIRDFVLTAASVLAGRVVDEKDHPLRGVRVVAYKGKIMREDNIPVYSPTSDTTTDSKGAFRFDDVEAGPVGLSVDLNDNVKLSEVVTAPPDDIVLRLQSEGGTLGGHVYLKSTGEGVEGATAVLYGRRKPPQFNFFGERRTAITDSTGTFQFDRLSEGEYRIQVSKGSLVQTPYKDPNKMTMLLGEKEKKTDLVYFLYPGATIHGRVTLLGTGEPLEGVVVREAWGEGWEKHTTITDGDGRYALAGLSGTGLALTAEKEGYRLVLSDRISNSVQVTLSPNESELNQDFQMMRNLSVSGTVKTEDGSPVSNALVSVSSEFSRGRVKKTSVKEDGTYSVEVSPFTSLRVKAEAPGYPVALSDAVKAEDSSVNGVDIVLKPGGTVSGTVTTPDGEPGAGATVNAARLVGVGETGSPERMGTATSDESGHFTLTNLPAKELSLYAREKGFASSRFARFTLSAGETKSDVALQLRTAHFIAGHVTDGYGNPVVSALVAANAQEMDENSYGAAQSDDNGSYRINGLSDTPHMVTVASSEGQKNKQNVEVDQDNIDFVLGSKKNVTLVGTVIDATTKQPIHDFEVQLNSGTASVERDASVPGKFRVKNLRAGGRYPVRITASGYVDNDSVFLNVPKGVETFERTFELGKGGTLMGRVVDKVSGHPVAGVRVYLRGAGNLWQLHHRPPVAVVNTGDDGKFQFANVSAGRNQVNFHPSLPLVDAIRTVEVMNGQTTDLGDVTLSGGGVVRGKVVKDPYEVPVPGVEIELREPIPRWAPRNVKTDANGAFEFTAVPAGSYTVSSAQLSLSSNLDLKDGATKDVVLHVGASGLKGRVTKGGEPIRVVVSLSKLDEKLSVSVYSRGDGTFEITNLPAGTYSVLVYLVNDWQTHLRHQVTLTAGQTLEKDIVFPNGRIVGRVIDDKEEPIGSTFVVAHSPALAEPNSLDSTRQTQSQSDGTFTIDGLPAGTYSVTASKRGVGMARQDGVEVPADGPSEPVELRVGSSNGGTVISVALDMNGKAIETAWCHLIPPGGVPLTHGASRDKTGTMKITGVPAGTYTMEVSARGYTAVSRPIEVKAGETQTFDDVLSVAGDLWWTLTDANGRALSGVACKLVPNDATSIEEPRSGTTDAKGRFVQHGLIPGAYTATATLPGGRTATEVFTIEASQVVQRTTKIE